MILFVITLTLLVIVTEAIPYARRRPKGQRFVAWLIRMGILMIFSIPFFLVAYWVWYADLSVTFLAVTIVVTLILGLIINRLNAKADIYLAKRAKSAGEDL